MVTTRLTVWTATSNRPLGTRSISRPVNRPSTIIGAKRQKAATPTMNGEPVSSSASQPSTRKSSQRPTLTQRPASQRRRKWASCSASSADQRAMDTIDHGATTAERPRRPPLRARREMVTDRPDSDHRWRSPTTRAARPTRSFYYGDGAPRTAVVDVAGMAGAAGRDLRPGATVTVPLLAALIVAVLLGLAQLAPESLGWTTPTEPAVQLVSRLLPTVASADNEDDNDGGGDNGDADNGGGDSGDEDNADDGGGNGNGND